MTGFGVTVQQNDRAALAADLVMQANAIDLGESLLKAGENGAGRTQGRSRRQQRRGAKACCADKEVTPGWCCERVFDSGLFCDLPCNGIHDFPILSLSRDMFATAPAASIQ
ncbi:MAG: hypothetical protein ACREEM_18275 [Blastocatellia bacterium]